MLAGNKQLIIAPENDRVNERILIDNGYLWEDPEQVDENVFKTDAYKMGQYEGRIRRQLPNLKLGVHSFTKKAGRDKNAVRNVQNYDGILLPRFRLPTEAEWEFAALALVGNTKKKTFLKEKFTLGMVMALEIHPKEIREKY